MARVTARARLREDRAGDPLDGLVNLFDLGIVLAVAFLLAALSSIDISPSELRENRQREATRDPREVVLREGEKAEQTRLNPGEEVVGRGRPLGTVYELDDGRTILVRPEDGEGGAEASDAPANSQRDEGAPPAPSDRRATPAPSGR